MIIRIKGKESAIEDLEKVTELLEEAKKILYRVPSQIELEVNGRDTESKIINSQDTQ